MFDSSALSGKGGMPPRGAPLGGGLGRTMKPTKLFILDICSYILHVCSQFNIYEPGLRIRTPPGGVLLL